MIKALAILIILGSPELPPDEYRGETTAVVVFVSEPARLDATCSRVLGERNNWRVCQICEVIYMSNPCNRRYFSDAFSATLRYMIDQVNDWRH